MKTTSFKLEQMHHFLLATGTLLLSGLLAAAAGVGPSGDLGTGRQIDLIDGPVVAGEDNATLDGSTDVELGGSSGPAIAVNPTDASNLAVADLFSIRVSTDGGIIFQPPVLAKLFPGSDEDGDGLDGEDPVDLVDNDQDGLIDEDPTYQKLSGSPSLAFDSLGRAFWTYLISENARHDSDENGSLDSTTRQGADIAIAQVNPESGEFLAGYPVNITRSAAVNLPAIDGNHHDKEWLAIDRFAGSSFQDRMYVAWTRFLDDGATEILTSFSTNQGVNWSAPVTLTTATEGFVWPAHNAVASNGDVYVAYHSQPGQGICDVPDGTSGQVLVVRSTNGGFSYPQKSTAFAPGNADISFNVQVAPRTLEGSATWTQGSAQPWILPDPIDPNQVYIVAADDPTNTNHGAGFDDMDIFIARSPNRGINWSAPTRIDEGPAGTMQLFPSAGIDDQTGCITVSWYDTRNGATNLAGNFLLEFYTRSSDDGGLSFGSEVQINDLIFDPDFGPAPCRFNCIPGTDNDGDGLVDEDPCDGQDNDGDGLVDEDPVDIPTLRIGDYTGVAVAGGKAHLAWTGNDVDGQQILYDKILACDVGLVADAGEDQTVECTSPDGTPVTLDGTGSSGSGDDPLTYTWTGPFGSVDGPMPTVLLPHGVHEITLTVQDTFGGSDTDTVIVTIEDTTPPEFKRLTVNPSELWPPNHKMKDVTVSAFVTDLCDSAPVCRITEIVSNEPVNGTGDGNTSPDWEFTGAPGDLTARIRAERAGPGNGRIYTLTVRCTDSSGNGATDTVTVTVPHDQGKGKEPVQPIIVSPPPHTILPGSTVTFTWDHGSYTPSRWAITVGTYPDGMDSFIGVAGSNATSLVASDLPRDGSKLYVKLWIYNSSWISVDEEIYIASNEGPHLTSPAIGSEITESEVTFTWDPSDVKPAAWGITVGRNPGGQEIFVSKAAANATSLRVTGLPLDGQPLHVRLWFYKGRWTPADDKEYQTSSNTPRVMSPLPDIPLDGDNAYFAWDRGDITAPYWGLTIGSQPDGKDIYVGWTDDRFNWLDISELPQDGRKLYVKLWCWNGSWHPLSKHEYKASGKAP